MKTSFLEKISNSSQDIILLKDRDSFGFMAFYFVKMLPTKKVMLTKMPIGKEYDIAEYGDILYSGYGEPTQAIIDEINVKYNTSF